MDWIHFNDNETKSGVEGRFHKDSETSARIFISGTNHPMDWARNIRLRKVPIGPKANCVRVNHEDYREAQWVIEYLSQRCDLQKLQKLTVAGHSRGAAIAQVVVYLIIQQFPHINRGGVLLAPKRTGNRVFRKAIEPYVVAYRRRGDIVPFLPPWPFYWNPYTVKFGEWTWKFWNAHAPKSYHYYYDKYQLR